MSNSNEAMTDLARVVIAFSGITSKADAIRRMHLVSMPPARIAGLLSMPVNHVTSAINKLNKKSGENGRGKGKRRG